MSKRVFIGVGHGGTDPGAVANGLRESDINLVVACAMKLELERYDGITVGISRTKDENDPLTEEIFECNTFVPDIAVECHANAGGGDGWEGYIPTNKHNAESKRLAKLIEKRVLTLGQNSRGVKTRLNGGGADYFGWNREVKCPNILCEAAFLDNKADVQSIDTQAEQAAFGVAYAHAVLEYFGIAPKSAKTTLYGVMKQVIALSDEQRAAEYATQLNAQGDNSAYYKVIEIGG